MNRNERRKAAKGMSDERIDVTGIVVHFKSGQYVNLDINKVQVIDKDTKRPLFEEVLDATPTAVEAPSRPSQEFTQDDQNYSVEFDTPEGRMVYVKNGNWSGVKPA